MAGKAKDLTGYITESGVTVIKRVENKGNRVQWLCRCFCGKEFVTRSDSLKSGHTKSCGCLQKEKAKELAKRIGGFNKKDYTGVRNGKLVAIEPTKERKYDNIIVWKCQCDCGNIIYLPGSRLISPNGPKSCGCMRSLGEAKIQKILQEHNIKYISQASFNSCRFKDTNYLAKFDFYVQNKYLIEYDGNTHYFANGYGWNNEDNLIKVKEHDKIKNEWCQKNNIPLIRIPYTIYDTLSLEDLLIETSKYIVNINKENNNE